MRSSVTALGQEEERMVWNLPFLSWPLAAAACASATHASVAGAAAGHDGSAGGAGGGVAHVDDVLHGVGGVVDAAVFEGQVVRSQLSVLSQAAAGAEVGGDSLLGWGGGVVVVLAVKANRRSFDFAQDDTTIICSAAI